MLVELIIRLFLWSWGKELKNTNAAPFLQDIHSAQFIHVDLSCWEAREERRARAQSITTTSVPRKCSRLPDKCTSTKSNHPNGMHRTAWAYIRRSVSFAHAHMLTAICMQRKNILTAWINSVTAGSISLDSRCWDLWSASLWARLFSPAHKG